MHSFSQIIYYGVPGSGKSNKIDDDLADIPEEQKLRVVFHPEYTNADFVGQIQPLIESDGVEYKFRAGPFSRIIKRAYQNPQKKFYLIIEEINRGNAAAIFGDLFQLLDRDESGFSKYPIENLDINAFIRSQSHTCTDKVLASTVIVGNTEFTELTGIRLPPNLSLLATMNTSDQNVFTLDNAFQRRWDMKLVENRFGDTQQEKKQRDAEIAGTGITWGSFQTKINEEIRMRSAESGLSSMEDRRMGCWFVKNAGGKIPADVFAEKVLKYLWDDAFRFSRGEVFSPDYQTLEELENGFCEKRFAIFKNLTFAEQSEPDQQTE